MIKKIIYCVFFMFLISVNVSAEVFIISKNIIENIDNDYKLILNEDAKELIYDNNNIYFNTNNFVYINNKTTGLKLFKIMIFNSEQLNQDINFLYLKSENKMYKINKTSGELIIKKYSYLDRIYSYFLSTNVSSIISNYYNYTNITEGGGVSFNGNAVNLNGSMLYNGSNQAGTFNHSNLTRLSYNDHPQYALVSDTQTITVCPSGCQFSSIQSAYNAINSIIKGNIIIDVGNGTYNENLDFAGKVSDGLFSITLQGKNKTDLSTTITSGTTGTDSIQATITNTGASWTIDQFKGNWIKFTSGNNVGNIRMINNNTATKITLIGSYFLNAFTNGDTFVIYSNNVTIDGDIELNPSSIEMKLYNLNINGLKTSQNKITLTEINHTVSNFVDNTYVLTDYIAFRNYYNYPLGATGLWFSDSNVKIHQSYFKGNGDTGYGYYWAVLSQSGGQQILYCGNVIDNISWGIWASIGGFTNLNSGVGSDPQCSINTHNFIKNTQIGVIANSGGHVVKGETVYTNNVVNENADALSYSWIGI